MDHTANKKSTIADKQQETALANYNIFTKTWYSTITTLYICQATPPLFPICGLK